MSVASVQGQGLMTGGGGREDLGNTAMTEQDRICTATVVKNRVNRFQLFRLKRSFRKQTSKKRVQIMPQVWVYTKNKVGWTNISVPPKASCQKLCEASPRVKCLTCQISTLGIWQSCSQGASESAVQEAQMVDLRLKDKIKGLLRTSPVWVAGHLHFN